MNMRKKLMWKLAVKNIMYSKRRGILIIFTIMLSVCLVFSVLTYWNSYNNIQKEEAISKEGEYHAEYLRIGEWQAKKLKNDKSIKKCYVAEEAENVKIINDKLVNNYINPKAISFEEVENVWQFYKGGAPKAENEIVIEKWVIETLGLKPDLNQKINITFSIKDEESGAETQIEQEFKAETQIEQEFKIVGVLNDIESLRANNYSYIIFNKEYLNKLTQDIDNNVKILLKSNFECEKQIKNLATDLGISKDDTRFNTVYVEAYGIGFLDIFGIAATITLIMFVAAMVVFNIYNIYFVQTVKMYGTFKAIGATEQQLGAFSFCETIIFGTIGNIVGVILGTGVSYCVIPFIDQINNSLTKIVVNVSMVPIMISIIVGYFIVLGAAFYPHRKIRKISIVGAYNYNPVNIGKRSDKRSLTKKMNIKYLAYIRISRYKKKILFSVISITSMYLLFIVASSVLGSMSTENLSNLMIGGDFSIQISDDISRGEERKDILDTDFIYNVDNLEEIEENSNIMYDRMVWNTRSAKEHIDLPEEYQELGIGFDNIDSVLYGYDNEFFEKSKKYLSDGEINTKQFVTGNYAIVVEDGITHIAPGESLYLLTSEGEEIELEVLGVVSNNITYRGYKASGCDIIIHQNLFEKLGLDARIQRIVLTAKEEKENQLESDLKKLIKGKDGVTIVSYADLNKEFEENKKIMSIVSYAFLAVLALIVVFNSINTTFTNILSRKRELGVLEAIGLTSKQEKMLLQLENLFIIAISSLGGMALGFPIGYIAFLIFKGQANYAVYHFPIIESLLLIALFCLLQIVITKKCNDILNKQAIVEKIGYKE